MLSIANPPRAAQWPREGGKHLGFTPLPNHQNESGIQVGVCRADETVVDLHRPLPSEQRAVGLHEAVRPLRVDERQRAQNLQRLAREREPVQVNRLDGTGLNM